MKYIIGVDVDSVLRDFPHDLVRVIKREHPEWYNEEYPVPDQWEMDKCFNATADEINNVYWHEHTAEIMGNGTPIKENVDYLKKLLKSKEFQYLKRLELKDANEEIIKKILESQKQKKIARARGRGSLRKSREQNIREQMAVERGERRERGEEEVKIRTTPLYRAFFSR